MTRKQQKRAKKRARLKAERKRQRSHPGESSQVQKAVLPAGLSITEVQKKGSTILAVHGLPIDVAEAWKCVAIGVMGKGEEWGLDLGRWMLIDFCDHTHTKSAHVQIGDLSGLDHLLSGHGCEEIGCTGFTSIGLALQNECHGCLSIQVNSAWNLIVCATDVYRDYAFGSGQEATS